MADFEKNNTEDLEDYEPEIVDLDGEPFEIIDALEHNNETYLALVPYIENPEDESEDEDDETEFIILKEVEDENGEFCLATVDDVEIYNEIGEKFLAHFKELFESEDEE